MAGDGLRVVAGRDGDDTGRRWSRGPSDSSLLRAPRSLKDAVNCMLSNFSTTREPRISDKVSDTWEGVRATAPAIVRVAASTSARVTVPIAPSSHPDAHRGLWQATEPEGGACRTDPTVGRWTSDSSRSRTARSRPSRSRPRLLRAPPTPTSGSNGCVASRSWSTTARSRPSSTRRRSDTPCVWCTTERGGSRRPHRSIPTRPRRPRDRQLPSRRRSHR